MSPFRMTHVDPASAGDFNDEPFDFWTEDIDFQHPSDFIAFGAGRPWTGFAALSKNAGCTMEKNRRSDEGLPVPDETGAS